MRLTAHVTSSTDTYLAISATYISSYEYSPRVTFFQLAVPLGTVTVQVHTPVQALKEEYQIYL